MKEKKDPMILEDFFPFSFSSFPSTVTRAFPWPIKGKAGHPMKGTQTHRTPNTWLSSNRAPSAPVYSFHQTWDLSLYRPFVTPTTNFWC